MKLYLFVFWLKIENITWNKFPFINSIIIANSMHVMWQFFLKSCDLHLGNILAMLSFIQIKSSATDEANGLTRISLHQFGAVFYWNFYSHYNWTSSTANAKSKRALPCIIPLWFPTLSSTHWLLSISNWLHWQFQSIEDELIVTLREELKIKPRNGICGSVETLRSDIFNHKVN
jgi:hypothetical protein